MRTLSVLCLCAVAALRSIGSAIADEGMWLINRPPMEPLQKRYGFAPTPQWLEHVQKSAVRMGASGSFVSPRGLILTNHHVGSDQLEKLSTPSRNLLDEGFYAATPEAELRCPDMEVNVLWSIEDVTDQVQSAASADLSPADAGAARRKRMSELEKESEQASGLHSEVVVLFHGARYHLYRYKKYTDLRLVMAPEQSIAFYGGDTDNFEYPRFDLDMCFFRAYENGQPAAVKHYLKWSSAGAAENDLAIVLGHPGRTNRQYTVDHFKFLRDVEMPLSLNRLWRREVELATFRARNKENERIAAGDFFGVQNGRKARTGFAAALHDPATLASKVDAERALRAFVAADPRRQADWGSAWDEVRSARENLRSFYASHQVLEERIGGGSALFDLARRIVRMTAELPKPSAERLREYRDSELDTLQRELRSPAPIYPAIEINRLASGLRLALDALGGEHAVLVQALAGKSPVERATELVNGSKLINIADRATLIEGGSAAVSASADPMIRLAALLDPAARALRKRMEDEVESIESAAYSKIAAAQFSQQGEAQFPDATGTLRFSFGPIRGYQEDGEKVPSFTNFAGLFERHQQRKGEPGFALPPRWIDAKSKLTLDTPLNFVCTADIIGGNSGSPVVNTDGQVIGLIFDGNIQSLAWNVSYDDKQARAVALDVRAIIEALRKVYGADALADELIGK